MKYINTNNIARLCNNNYTLFIDEMKKLNSYYRETHSTSIAEQFNKDITPTIHKCIQKQPDNPFILGGGEIYKQALDYADALDLTLVHHSFDEADTFFPALDFTQWQETFREDFKADEKHNFDYSFVSYKKSEF